MAQNKLRPRVSLAPTKAAIAATSFIPAGNQSVFHLATVRIVLLCLFAHALSQIPVLQIKFLLSFYNQQPLRFFGLPWITSQFIHIDASHLFWNLAVFYVCAIPYEMKFGKRMVYLLFLMGGITGTIALLLTSSENLRALGASDGVSALLIAHLLTFKRFKLFPELGQVGSKEEGGIPSYFLLLYFIVPNVLGAYLGFTDSKVGYVGHLGGMALGLLVWMFQSELADKLESWRARDAMKPVLQATIGIVAVATLANVAQSRFPSEVDQEPKFEVSFKNVIERGDQRYLVRLTNVMLFPEAAPFAVPIKSEEDIVRLAENQGIPESNSSLQYVLMLYRNARRDPSGVLIRYRDPLSLPVR